MRQNPNDQTDMSDISQGNNERFFSFAQMDSADQSKAIQAGVGDGPE
jgi:hypothetical protein